MVSNEPCRISDSISITPLLVPHRDEYSETVGFRIRLGRKSVLFIPDIDKWSKWDKDIRDEIGKVDHAFIDGTFYQNGEIARDMSQIPHPFISESMSLFQSLSPSEKRKINFIHFNHSNPVMHDAKAKATLKKAGYQIAYEGQVIK
jgi:pyrroloquinoline quinone biosynthesis protein B